MIREVAIQALLNAWTDNQTSDNPARNWVEMLDAQDIGLSHLTDAGVQLGEDIADRALALGAVREEIANM